MARAVLSMAPLSVYVGRQPTCSWLAVGGLGYQCCDVTVMASVHCQGIKQLSVVLRAPFTHRFFSRCFVSCRFLAVFFAFSVALFIRVYIVCSMYVLVYIGVRHVHAVVQLQWLSKVPLLWWVFYFHLWNSFSLLLWCHGSTGKLGSDRLNDLLGSHKRLNVQCIVSRGLSFPVDCFNLVALLHIEMLVSLKNDLTGNPSLEVTLSTFFFLWP